MFDAIHVLSIARITFLMLFSVCLYGLQIYAKVTAFSRVSMLVLQANTPVQTVLAIRLSHRALPVRISASEKHIANQNHMLPG